MVKKVSAKTKAEKLEETLAEFADRAFTKARELPLGFSIGAIKKGGSPESASSAIMQAQPQVIFRGRRLFVVPSRPNVIIVQDLKVGKDSQFVACAPVPAEMFGPLSYGSDMNLDTAQVSMIISLFVASIGKKKATVTAGLIGTSIY